MVSVTRTRFFILGTVCLLVSTYGCGQSETEHAFGSESSGLAAPPGGWPGSGEDLWGACNESKPTDLYGSIVNGPPSGAPNACGAAVPMIPVSGTDVKCQVYIPRNNCGDKGSCCVLAHEAGHCAQFEAIEDECKNAANFADCFNCYSHGCQAFFEIAMHHKDSCTANKGCYDEDASLPHEEGIDWCEAAEVADDDPECATGKKCSDLVPSWSSKCYALDCNDAGKSCTTAADCSTAGCFSNPPSKHCIDGRCAYGC